MQWETILILLISNQWARIWDANNWAVRWLKYLENDNKFKWISLKPW